jgi:transposase
MMFGLTTATRIYVAVEAIDMRKGFEGLHGLVRDHLKQDPLSGHLFLFTNKTRTRLKALVWDGSGLWVCAKRLEKGRFRWPVSNDHEARSVTLRSEELAMLVGGLDLKQTVERRWYRRTGVTGH